MENLQSILEGRISSPIGHGVSFTLARTRYRDAGYAEDFRTCQKRVVVDATCEADVQFGIGNTHPRTHNRKVIV
jgi:hypothetical protein